MRFTLFFVLFFSFIAAFGQPKAVKNAYASVASVLAYKDGTLKADGSAVFVGSNGDILASRKIFEGADSAVVIDNAGKVRPVKHIVGTDNMFDCVKVRVASDKKIKSVALSSAKVNVGEELYMLTYGVKKNVGVEAFKVLAVDSVYSLAYYTLDHPADERCLSYPLINGKGELVALMQPSSSGDTVKCYAVSSSLSSSLVSSTRNYGKGFYPGMNIRTAMPDEQSDALSCLYMQAIMGDSISWGAAIDDYISLYPQSYEGYQSLAEYAAVCRRDMQHADEAWKKALTLAENKAEVYFGKGKVIKEIVQGGDSLSHAMLSYDNALSHIDKAVSIDANPLYISYKADMLFGLHRYNDAATCYESLAVTDMRGADIFAKGAQCYVMMGEHDKALALLDSAVCCFGVNDKNVAPYILTRAIVKSSAKRYREAVRDMNSYEEIVGGMLTADFYYMREQAELNCKMYQQALNDIETAIDLAPGNVLYYLEKGMLCYRVKFTQEGIRTMQKACEIAPEAADAYYLLGRLYMQQGDKEKAKPALEYAVELGHPDAEIQLQSIIADSIQDK